MAAGASGSPPYEPPYGHARDSRRSVGGEHEAALEEEEKMQVAGTEIEFSSRRRNKLTDHVTDMNRMVRLIGHDKVRSID